MKGERPTVIYWTVATSLSARNWCLRQLRRRPKSSTHVSFDPSHASHRASWQAVIFFSDRYRYLLTKVCYPTKLTACFLLTPGNRYHRRKDPVSGFGTVKMASGSFACDPCRGISNSHRATFFLFHHLLTRKAYLFSHIVSSQGCTCWAACALCFTTFFFCVLAVCFPSGTTVAGTLTWASRWELFVADGGEFWVEVGYWQVNAESRNLVPVNNVSCLMEV